MKKTFGTDPLDLLGSDPIDLDIASMRESRVKERFLDGEVRVLEVDVFADERDGDLVLRFENGIDEGAPVGHVRLGRG